MFSLHFFYEARAFKNYGLPILTLKNRERAAVQLAFLRFFGCLIEEDMFPLFFGLSIANGTLLQMGCRFLGFRGGNLFTEY